MNRLMNSLLSIALLLAAVANSAPPTLKEVLETEDSAQEAKEDSIQETATAAQTDLSGPTDDYNRGTPRSSMQGFLDAARDSDFERAAHYLDLRYLPYHMDRNQASEYARKLRIVLDRAMWLDLTLISSDPKGHVEEGLLTFQERIARLDVDGKQVDILMQRVPRADGVLIWKISGATVGKIPELYQEYGYGKLGESLAKKLPPYKFLGLELWQWIILCGLILTVFVVVYIPTKIVCILIKRSQLHYRDQFASLCAGPIRLYIILVVGGARIDMIHPTAAFKALMNARTIVMVSFIWLCFGLIGLLRDYLRERFERQEKRTAAVLLRPVANIFKGLIVVVALMVWFENAGLKATTVLTGLGLGGLAVALATQKSIENLIGAITLYATAPVKVGDFCKFGESVGTVEDIGLRYTRIRTLGRTVIHIPNASFVDMHLEAYSYREKIWYHPTIKISRETSPEQMRYILVEIRKMLYAHPMVCSDPARVRFKEFGEYSLDIRIFAYIDTTAYSEFLEVSEDLNLRIMEIIHQAGAALAIPTQSIRHSESIPVDPELKKKTEETVSQWRQDQELYLPEFPETEIQQLRSTLPYPPEGAPPKEE